MAEQQLERIYNVPLRAKSAVAPKYRRAAKALRVLREFLERNLKSNNVKIGKYLNQKVLEHGRKNIPHHVLVKAIKDKEGIVKAELVGAPEDKVQALKEVKKKDKVEALAGKVDQEAVVKEKQEEEKKKILEHPKIEKHKELTEKKEVTDEVDEEMRKKGMVKRKDKKEMISK